MSSCRTLFQWIAILAFLGGCGSDEIDGSTDLTRVANGTPDPPVASVPSTTEVLPRATETTSAPMTSESPSATAAAESSDALVAAPFSFTNWGYPDLLISDFPSSLEQLRDQSDTVVVARLAAASIEPRLDGVLVLPVGSEGEAIPETELRAVHLAFEVTSVLGGMAYPRSSQPGTEIDVYIGYDADTEYVDLFNRAVNRVIDDGGSYLLFLRNVRIDSANGSIGERTSYYTVDPSTHEVYAITTDGTIAEVEPAFLQWEVEPTASTDDLEEALGGGLTTLRLSVLHHDDVVTSRPMFAEVAESLTTEPGASTTEPTRFFDDRLRSLPYPEGTYELVP